MDNGRCDCGAGIWIEGEGFDYCEGKMTMILGLLKGYYYPTRYAGHGRTFSAYNAVRLTYRGLRERWS